MKKKIVSFILAVFFIFTFFNVLIFADVEILSPTTVTLHKDRYDMPEDYYAEKGVNKYIHTYKDGTEEELYDFRGYFEILDNYEVILDVHAAAPIDKGGYEWDFGGFDLDVPGVYTITITYEGLSSTQSASHNVNVIEEDTEAPYIGLPNRNFNITKTDEDFEREFKRYLDRVDVYDNADGLIIVTIDYFSEEDIQAIKDANLRDKVIITLEITDAAGNTNSATATLTLVDTLAPTIQNIRTLITKQNKEIDNIIGHLTFDDNYSDSDKLIIDYTVYGTMLQKNEWEKGSNRKNDNKGDLIEHYIHLNGINDFLLFVEDKELKSGHRQGDYYKVNFETKTYYVYVEKKTYVEEEDAYHNTWKVTQDPSDFSGRLLTEYKKFPFSDLTEFMTYLNEEKEDAYLKYDFFRVRDVLNNDNYYVNIVNKIREFRDPQGKEVDYSEVGVQYVIVTAKDEYGNEAKADFRIVVENSISLWMIVLISNGALIVVVGATILLVSVIKPRKHNKKEESIEQ